MAASNGRTFGVAAAEDDLKACCAALYENPAVRWLLGGQLHPGGEATTRGTLRLLALARGDRLLDVGSGAGDSALLAAAELGCEVVGIDLGELAVRGARSKAAARGLDGRVSFLRADAEALPLADGSFDALLCECSLSTFPDKARAVDEMGRVLRPGGRVAISDVVADRDRLPQRLSGPIASLACVGGAMSEGGYEGLLQEAGFEVFAVESLTGEAASLAEQVEDRLRGARVLGLEPREDSVFGIREAIDAVRLARRAIEEGTLDYRIIAAERRS